MKQWLAIEVNDLEFHSLPVDDAREHDKSAVCWCHPRIEIQPNGKVVVMHNSLDGRENGEKGILSN
ncbi:MAG: hypothetical protein NUV86_12650 [Candidatus Scalindua sp.]|nr:hypothetical protein [Candidatus Scalindua sp.]